MQPLRIEFNLRHAMIAPSHPLHLDGLLFDLASDDPFESQRLEGVLTAEHRGDRWVYQASALRFEATMRFTSIKIRQPDEARYAEAARLGVAAARGDKIDSVSGYRRGYRLADVAMVTRRAVGYAIGDAEKIQVLLSRCKGLGAQRRNGWGDVADYAVVEDPDALNRWQARLMPWAVEGATALVARCHPPYYCRHLSGVAYAPAALLATEAGTVI